MNPHTIPRELLALAVHAAARQQDAIDAPPDPRADLTVALVECLAVVAFGANGDTPSRPTCLLARTDALALLKARLGPETFKALADGKDFGALRDRIGRDLRLSRRPV